MILRPMDLGAAGERSFIAKSWVESFSSSALAQYITFQGTFSNNRAPWQPSQEYWDTWNAIVGGLLESAHVTVADEDGLIAGFICWELGDDGVVVHYLYVRLMMRGQGVARALVESLPAGNVQFTHRSRGVRRVPSEWRFSLEPLMATRRGKEAAA